MTTKVRINRRSPKRCTPGHSETQKTQGGGPQGAEHYARSKGKKPWGPNHEDQRNNGSADGTQGVILQSYREICHSEHCVATNGKAETMSNALSSDDQQSQGAAEQFLAKLEFRVVWISHFWLLFHLPWGRTSPGRPTFYNKSKCQAKYHNKLPLAGQKTAPGKIQC